jgi:hypothetical protein
MNNGTKIGMKDESMYHKEKKHERRLVVCSYRIGNRVVGKNLERFLFLKKGTKES